MYYLSSRIIYLHVSAGIFTTRNIPKANSDANFEAIYYFKSFKCSKSLKIRYRIFNDF